MSTDDWQAAWDQARQQVLKGLPPMARDLYDLHTAGDYLVPENHQKGTLMSMTYGEALALSSVSIPEHLEAEAQVPVLTGPQAQGDLMIVPLAMAYEAGQHAPDWPQGDIVPMEGVQVVHGEATGNTHWLHAGFSSPGVTWYRADDGLVVGVVTVPAGQTAVLVHTDEHGANGIGGGGRYEIRRKREQLDEIAYVAD